MNRNNIGLTVLLALVFQCSLCASAFGQNIIKNVYKGMNDGALYYNIYPVPQKMVSQKADLCKFTYRSNPDKKVNIVAESLIDDVTISRAKQILEEHGLEYEVSDSCKSDCSNVLLGVFRSGEVVDKTANVWQLDKTHLKLSGEKFGMYDNHILCLTNNRLINEILGRNSQREGTYAQVLILGVNTDAVFCGLASLEQILDHEMTPPVIIYDWADVKHRGVIEGYYGVPYSAAVTKDLFRFMARYKLNTYMYGAKSDPYHSRYWGEPYPKTITPEQERIGYLTQEMMKDITTVARECKVDFIWAIHPGKAFAEGTDKDVITHIMKKFESMYSLGVRQFGVFVDDVGVSSDPKLLKLCADNLTLLQNTIDNKWNKKGAAPADTVKPLQYVPQLYAYSWVDEDKGRAFFTSLKDVPEKINIYITGANVWSVPNNEDIDHVRLGHENNGLGLGRIPGWWWNYLCNDQDMTKLFVADMQTNFRDESHIYSTSRIPADITLKTLIVNPMQQGELSKIGIFSVGDYAWNTAAFNSVRSWEAAVPAVVGKNYATDFMNIVPALRYYDNDEFEYLISRYKQSVERGKPAPGALLAELKKVNASCQAIKKMKDSEIESDRLFYNDLRPWLLKLEAMTAEAVYLLEKKHPEYSGKNSKDKNDSPGVSASSSFGKSRRDYENEADFRFEILGGMGEHIKMAERTAEPSAKCLLPFIQWLRER